MKVRRITKREILDGGIYNWSRLEGCVGGG